MQRSQKEVTHFLSPGPFSSTAEENNRNSNRQNSYLALRLIEGYKTKEIARDSGMKKVTVPFILGAKYEYQQQGIDLFG